MDRPLILSAGKGQGIEIHVQLGRYRRGESLNDNLGVLLVLAISSSNTSSGLSYLTHDSGI